MPSKHQKEALLLRPLPPAQQTQSRVPRPHAAKSEKTNESTQERLKATQRRKASEM